MSTKTTLTAMVAAIKTLVESIAALHVYDHEPAVIPNYPAACVTVDSFSVKTASYPQEDVKPQIKIIIFYRNQGTAEVDCRNTAASIIDLLQADGYLSGTAQDSGLGSGGFTADCGRYNKGNETLQAAFVIFTPSQRQSIP
jgi:hypothetical protein